MAASHRRVTPRSAAALFSLGGPAEGEMLATKCPFSVSAMFVILTHRNRQAKGFINKDSRDNCRIFEPWTPARDAFTTAFFGQREPHLTELWAMSENAA